MKRLFSILIVCTFFFSGYSQLSVKGNYIKISETEGVSLVILYSQIDNSSEIHFKSPNPSVIVRWFTFSNGIKKEIFNFSRLSSLETYIDPKNETGYIVSADGKETTIWVLDKSISSNGNELFFENTAGKRFPVNLNNENPGNWQNSSSTSFEISEEFSEENEDEISCKITTETSVRDAKNENQRPEAKTLEGSAPMEIQFFSNPEGNVTNYLWNIYKDGSLIISRTEKDHSYTFTETGKYKITLRVSNSAVSATDSTEVSISESKIAAPRIFTPNGDGFNDEFRIAYTSIVEFQGTILNRWGRVLFTWNNPQIGWDGNINGKPAPEGTYFYLIKARGSDRIPYQLKGHINLLR